MITLIYYGEELECDKCIKGEDWIKCYLNDEVIASFSGISDFSGYELLNRTRQAIDFDTPEPTKEELLEQRLKELERIINEQNFK